MTKPEPEPQPKNCKMYIADTSGDYVGFFIEFRTEVRRKDQLFGKLYLKDPASKKSVVPMTLPNDPTFPTKFLPVMDVDFEDAGGDSTAYHGDEEKIWAAWEKAVLIREEERHRREM
ncbi:hypothetical protein MY10362_004239 [Beauveria mimosiformis]